MEENNKDSIPWLQLARTPGIGPIKGWKLLQQFGNIDHVLERLPHKPTLTQIEDELALLDKKKSWVIARNNKKFPAQLAQIPDCPFVLYGKGNASILEKQQIAIVGARNASFIGKNLAEYFAKELGKNDIVITSGLAKGIDTAAHTAALETGTIAIMAGGIDHVYPSSNHNLYEKITQKGAVISEMPLMHEPAPYLFPKRNRIIAGLSQGIVVVEAVLNSGSLYTVKAALEYGREIFAIPGSPMDPRYRGSNSLIKQGAYLTESIHDVLDVIKKPTQTVIRNSYCLNSLELHASPYTESSVPLRESILNELSSTPILLEELLTMINAPLAKINSEISLLEIEGIIRRDHDLLIKV